MSSKCSFFYKDGIHAYRDCFSDELSLELLGVFFSDNTAHKIKSDRNYGNPCFSRETWKEFAEAILKELDSPQEAEDEVL